MFPDLRMQMADGSRSYPWAERLAADWRLAGLTVELESDTSGDAHLVRIESVGASIECELYLDRRKFQVVGPYLCFEVAAEMLRAGERVNLEELALQTFDFIDSASDPRFRGRRSATAGKTFTVGWSSEAPQRRPFSCPTLPRFMRSSPFATWRSAGIRCSAETPEPRWTAPRGCRAPKLGG